jgi:hypothetical protein
VSGKLAKALDRLRHEPPLQGGGEARPGRLWTGLKPKVRLDGRIPGFFSQRVIPRWRVTQGTNRHMVVGGRHAPVTSGLNLLQSSSSFFQSFVRHRPYRVPCPVPQRSLLVTLLSNQRAASDALPADENLDLAEFLTGLCFGR